MLELWGFLNESAGAWTSLAAIGGGLGWFVTALRSRKTKSEKDILDQEKEELRLALVKAEVRLDHIDPERFIDAATKAYDKADFAKVENLSFKFAERQQEAFGKAAEYLTEQRILDSENHPQAIADATRFAAIGRAAFPDNKRVAELSDLADRRAKDIRNGDPLEALNMDGLTDVELNQLSLVLSKDGKYALAEVAARRSVPLARLRTGEVSENHAAALSQFASCLRNLGQYYEAEGLYRQLLEIERATIGEAHPDNAIRLNNLALVVLDQGRFEEAEGLFRQALEIDRATIGEAHPGYATRLNNLAGVVQAQGRFEEAEGLFRQALEIDHATIGEAHPDYATHLNNLASVVQAQGRSEEAEGLFRQALEIDRATIGEAHPDYAIHLTNLARVVKDRGRFEEAEGLFRQALVILQATLPADHPKIATLNESIANLPPPPTEQN
jgi:tetratricopeptide (TPR) repeat protein